MLNSLTKRKIWIITALLCAGLVLGYGLWNVFSPKIYSTTNQSHSILPPTQQQWAQTAWRYFSNNTQPTTGLANSKDGQPITNLWQMGDNLIAIVSAHELNLITDGEFDLRVSKLLGSLNRLPLTLSGVPNRNYNTQSLQMVNYANQPGQIGWSSQDISRLLLALKMLSFYSPIYSEFSEQIVLRWNYCSLLDCEGQLLKGYKPPEANYMPVWVEPEGRLGFSEYSARNYALWGFKTDKSLQPPYLTTVIHGIPIDYDERDPRVTSVPVTIDSMPAILNGIEFQWVAPNLNISPLINTIGKKRADHVYAVQKLHWEQTHQLTAKADYMIDQAPWRIYDSVFANGYAWNTLGLDNKFYPWLSMISTKAAFGLHALWPDHYSTLLQQSVQFAKNDDRGWYEGRYNKTGDYNRSITLSTNATILETLLFQAKGQALLPINPRQAYFDYNRENIFSLKNQCIPLLKKLDVPNHSE